MKALLLPQSEGPFVTLAVLCRRWERDEIGTTTIHEMVDTLTWPGTTRREDGTYSARPRLQLVLELIAGSARGERLIEVGLYDEHDRLVGELLAFRRRFGADDDKARIVEHLRIPDSTAGPYRLRATCEGMLLTERALRMSHPDQENQSWLDPATSRRPALAVARHCVGLFETPSEPNSVYGMFEGLGVDVPAEITLGFLVYFIGGTYEAEHEVAIATYQSDGNACSPTYTYKAEFRTDRNIGIGNPAHQVSATAHATYWTEVRVDGDLLTRVPLEIFPPGSRNDRDGTWKGELTLVGDGGTVRIAGQTVRVPTLASDPPEVGPEPGD